MLLKHFHSIFTSPLVTGWWHRMTYVSIDCWLYFAPYDLSLSCSPEAWLNSVAWSRQQRCRGGWPAQSLVPGHIDNTDHVREKGTNMQSNIKSFPIIYLINHCSTRSTAWDMGWVMRRETMKRTRLHWAWATTAAYGLQGTPTQHALFK